MTLINIALAIILFIGILCQHSLKSMFEQIGKNMADIFPNREKEYESEKGRNLATKEDIEEITRKIEQVKAEITFKNQWKHDHIKKREERLARILYLAKKIALSENRIFIMSHNSYNVEKLFGIIEEINSYSVDLSMESNMMIVDYHQFKDIKPAIDLVDVSLKYAGELSALANNVACALQGSDVFRNKALENEYLTQGEEMKNALILQKQAQDYVNDPMNYKAPMKQAINKYTVWLEELYGKGVIINYEITEIASN